MTSDHIPFAAAKQARRAEGANPPPAVYAGRREIAGAARPHRLVAAFAGKLSGAVVSLYWPMRDEVDVRDLIDALAAEGARTALPVMSGRDAALVFREWRTGDALAPGTFGVHEPAADARILVPDIVVAPLLAFDAAGNRLGYGGGYYDRSLRALRAGGDVVAVGVGYDEQEISSVPGHTGDEILDMIITDRRTLRVGK